MGALASFRVACVNGGRPLPAPRNGPVNREIFREDRLGERRVPEPDEVLSGGANERSGERKSGSGLRGILVQNFDAV